jgi:hypothetical protein
MLAVYTVDKTIIKTKYKTVVFILHIIFYILKLQTVSYLLWMAITRLKNGLTSIEFEDIGYYDLDCAKYLRCSYADIENILLL